VEYLKAKRDPRTSPLPRGGRFDGKTSYIETYHNRLSPEPSEYCRRRDHSMIKQALTFDRSDSTYKVEFATSSYSGPVRAKADNTNRILPKLYDDDYGMSTTAHSFDRGNS
jgi:hypothetical protein